LEKNITKNDKGIRVYEVSK